MKCNIAEAGAKPVRLWLTAGFNGNTNANLPDDFGKSRGEKKWAVEEADVGKAAKTPPAVTLRSMFDGCNAMAC